MKTTVSLMNLSAKYLLTFCTTILGFAQDIFAPDPDALKNINRRYRINQTINANHRVTIDKNHLKQLDNIEDKGFFEDTTQVNSLKLVLKSSLEQIVTS